MSERNGIVIRAGRDRAGQPEVFDTLTLRPGEVWAVVGPTGSGKSRLLADVEWLAQGDSPSGRRVEALDPARPLRVARVAQQMQFAVDLKVGEFLRLHASLRWREPGPVVDTTLAWANRLVGEPFGPATPLAWLSGGQSRALMIADALHVSRADVLLVDEIENAGIARAVALDALVESGAVVLLATHDPLVALQAPKRVVLKGGGVCALRERTAAEVSVLNGLKADAQQTERLRARVVAGHEAAGEGADE